MENKSPEQKILKEIFSIQEKNIDNKNLYRDSRNNNQDKRSLSNSRVQPNKVLICFSGIPCTGKTHVAKIIEKKYFGVRINTDDIRKIIKSLGKKYPRLLDEEYKEKILHTYLEQLLEKYPFKNNLIILDKGIDRDYEKISAIVKKKKFKIILIRIQATKKIAEHGAILKLGKPDSNFINNINRWVKEYKQFGKTHKADIIIKNNLKNSIQDSRNINKTCATLNENRSSLYSQVQFANQTKKLFQFLDKKLNKKIAQHQ